MKRLLVISVFAILVLTFGAGTAAEAQSAVTEGHILTNGVSGLFNRFGVSVDVDRDTIVVGASEDDCAAGPDCGAAYVFIRDGVGWRQQGDKLTAGADAAAGAQFGHSVSVHNNTILVGTGANCAGNPTCDEVYLFSRSGEVWTRQARLTDDEATRFNAFGRSVSVHDDTAVVSAIVSNCPIASFPYCGAAYVFRRDGTNWSREAVLKTDIEETFDFYGPSVALHGGTVVIGQVQDCASLECGSATIFVRIGTSWSQQAGLTAGDSNAEGFGLSVAVAGNTAIVGALDHCVAGANCGAAYVFAREGRLWTEQARLVAEDAADGDFFGSSVALYDGLAEDTAVIGAPNKDCDKGNFCGAVYVFLRGHGGWGQRVKLTASDAGSQNHFGSSVTAYEKTAVAGALGLDCHANRYACGAAYVYRSDFLSAEGVTLAVDMTDDDASSKFWQCTPAVNDCSLRGAIRNANMAPGLDIIQLGSGTYKLDYGPLVLSSDIELIGTEVVPGSTPASVISGEGKSGVLRITQSASVLVSDVMISRGWTILPATNGAGVAIESGSLVTLRRVVLSDNSSGLNGGAIFNAGFLRILSSKLKTNSALINVNIDDPLNAGRGRGGTIFNQGGVLTINNSEIHGNQASAGAGIFNDQGRVRITNSSITLNKTFADPMSCQRVSGCGDGGGIYHLGGTLRLINVTISTNTAGRYGGGLYINNREPWEEARIDYSTIAHNQLYHDGIGGVTGAGVYQPVPSSDQPTYIRGSIIALNTRAGAPANCGGEDLISLDNNLSDHSCILPRSGDLIGVDPLLGPLVQVAWQTAYHPLLQGSPAIDHIDPKNFYCPAFDQLGLFRPLGGRCDIGAIEFDP